MYELSIHILDVAQNAVNAGANLVEIDVIEDESKDLLTIRIADDGCGMDAELLKGASDPFVTSHEKDVGLGLPLLKRAAEEAGGGLDIESTPGKGTAVTAYFVLSSIDRLPLGDLSSTMLSLVFGAPQTDFVYRHVRNSKESVFDTRKVKELVGGDVRSDVRTIRLVRQMLNECS